MSYRTRAMRVCDKCGGIIVGNYVLVEAHHMAKVGVGVGHYCITHLAELPLHDFLGSDGPTGMTFVVSARKKDVPDRHQPDSLLRGPN